MSPRNIWEYCRPYVQRLFVRAFVLWTVALVARTLLQNRYLAVFSGVDPDLVAWIAFLSDYLFYAWVGLATGLIFKRDWLPVSLIVLAIRFLFYLVLGLAVGSSFFSMEFLTSILLGGLVGFGLQLLAAFWGFKIWQRYYVKSSPHFSNRRKATIVLTALFAAYFVLPGSVDIDIGPTITDSGPVMLGGLHPLDTVEQVETALGLPLEEWTILDSADTKTSETEETIIWLKMRIDEICVFRHCGPLEMVFRAGELMSLDFWPTDSESFLAYLNSRKDLHRSDSNVRSVNSPEPVSYFFGTGFDVAPRVERQREQAPAVVGFEFRVRPFPESPFDR